MESSVHHAPNAVTTSNHHLKNHEDQIKWKCSVSENKHSFKQIFLVH